jgi:4-amino-4-deoxy-L-arabinose transferase-like glycosyltransferase
VWVIVALVGIFSHGPMPMYSTRTLAVAWEMWNQGHWLVPHINGEPYSEKVPLVFWLIHAGWAVFGVNDVWPRLLEVAYGGAQLVLISTLAHRLFPNRPWVAKAAPWMLLCLAYAFLFGMQIMYDVLLAVWALAALLCLTPRRDRAEPRWWIFGICVGLGLLTKGPVMLLHIAFPFLLGPLWNDWARQHRARWYGFGVLALLGGFAMLLAWALPAGFSGGDGYRQRLFFTQTAGRVVDAFDHAKPFWFYIPLLPVLMFPLSAWPRAWVALAMLRRPLEPGVRFLLCWVVPVLITFSIISGKQPYYPLPEYAGGALLIAAAVALLRERHPTLASHYALGTWPLAVGGFALAVLMLALPWLSSHGRLNDPWLIDFARYSAYFGIVFAILGIVLLLRGRGETRRLAIAGLVGTLALNTLFTLSSWQKFDMAPAAAYLGRADAAGRAIGNLAVYEGQFHFAGRMTHPVARLHEGQEIQDFARVNPNGLIISYGDRLDANDLRYAELVQPFRSDFMVVWTASTLAALRQGRQPAEPRTPTLIYPPDYWRYRAVQ